MIWPSSLPYNAFLSSYSKHIFCVPQPEQALYEMPFFFLFIHGGNESQTPGAFASTQFCFSLSFSTNLTTNTNYIGSRFLFSFFLLGRRLVEDFDLIIFCSLSVCYISVEKFL